MKPRMIRSIHVSTFALPVQSFSYKLSTSSWYLRSQFYSLWWSRNGQLNYLPRNHSTSKDASTSGSEFTEAQLKHFRLKRLLQSNYHLPSPKSVMKNDEYVARMENESRLLEQKYLDLRKRNAIIHSVLSFILLMLAGQGWHTGQEKRIAQSGREQAEEQLRETHEFLRQKLVRNDDHTLQPLAQACVQAIHESKSNSLPKRSWLGSALSPIFYQNATNTYQEEEKKNDQIQCIVQILQEGLTHQLNPILLSKEEKEKQELEQKFTNTMTAQPMSRTLQLPSNASSEIDNLTTKTEILNQSNALDDEASTPSKKVFGL